MDNTFSNYTWILNGKNYSSWRQVIQAQLEYKELWYLIRRETADPLKGEEIIKDREALFILKASISPVELDKTGVCSTSKELWLKLQDNYTGSKQALTGSVSAAWAVFCAQPGEDLITYCGRFEQLLSKLAAVQYTVPEDQKFHFFMRSLPKDRREFCFTWQMVNPTGKISDLVSAVKSRYHTDLMLEGPSAERDNLALISGPMKNMVGSKRSSSKKSNTSTSPSTSSSTSPVSSDDKNKELVCNHCDKPGHKWQVCPDLKKQMQNKYRSRVREKNPSKNQPSKDDAIFMAIENGDMLKEQQTWVADSGATSHVTPYVELLSDYFEFITPHKILTGGNVRLAMGCGNFHYKCGDYKGTLTQVLYAPEFPTNIFSLDRVMNLGFKIILDGKQNTVQILNVSNTVLLEGEKESARLTRFKLKPDQDKCFLGATLDEWHERFGHVSKDTVNGLLKNNMVLKLDIVSTNLNPCIDCLLGKICKAKHPLRATKISSELATALHFDTAGPMPRSINGNKYLVVAIDDYSNYRFVESVVSKDEVKNSVKRIVMQVMSMGKSVATIISDNGTEYINQELQSWLSEKGITHSTSSPYTPQQNGSSERAIRAIVEAAKTSMRKSGLGETVWDEACGCATYGLNRVNSPRDKRKTRFELFYGLKPDVGNLRVFGQFVVAKIPFGNTKFGPKGIIARFVNYTSRYNTYRILVSEEKKIVETCNVRFMPMTFKVPVQQDESNGLREERVLLPNTRNTPNNDSLIDFDSRHIYHEILDTENPSLNESTNNVHNINDEIHQEILERTGNANQEGRVLRASTRDLTPSRIPIFQSIPYRGRALLADVIEEQESEQNEIVYTTQNFTINGEPSTLKEAKERPDWPEWEAAVNSELNSLAENDTWDLVDRPKNHKVVKSRWVFVIKYKSDGNIDKYKARLVAKGFTQVSGIDFHETFAPVVSFTTIRLLISLAVQRGLELHQFDIETAFLNGDLDEEIFMDLPESRSGDQVCKLKKALYGLRQSPRQWNLKFNNFLTEFKLKQCETVDCFYFNDDQTILLALYVDDGLVATKNRGVFDNLVKYMSKHFKVKAHPATTFLNMEILKTEEGIILHQSAYVKRILERFQMTDCNSVATPEETGLVDYDNGLQCEFEHKQMVGSLMYLSTCTRPDISHAVNIASRTNNPTIAHKALLKRIMRYLSGTRNLGIGYTQSDQPLLEGFSDSDWANCVETRRSTSGLLICYANSPLWWRTVRQPITALSSTEAEYIAGCELVKELIPVRNTLAELKAIDCRPVSVYIDNQSAIKMSKDVISRQRTKHIDVRSRWLSEHTNRGTIEVKHIPGTKQPADFFTKPLSKVKFAELRKIVMNIFLILSMVSIISGEMFSAFTRVNPIYYKKSQINYLTNSEEIDLYVLIANPCSNYFGKTLVDSNLNLKLEKDCDVWFKDHTMYSLKHCKAVNEVNTQMTSNTIRTKRAVPAIPVLIYYTVVAGTTAYNLVSGIYNTENAKTLKDALNDERVALRQAHVVFNATRESLHELSDRNYELEKRVLYLNDTITGFLKAMALLVETFSYFGRVKESLEEINEQASHSKVSLALLSLVNNSTLWEEPAEKYSSLNKCEYSWNKSGLKLHQVFTIPKIDKNVEILEVTSHKFWNISKSGSFCRMKYAGARLVLANRTDPCFMGIDGSWVHNGSVEGHPCRTGEISDTERRITLDSLNHPFHREACFDKFTASTMDIQIKRINGFFHIYCFGHRITLDRERDCPDFVFKIPVTDYYKVNNHEHLKISKMMVVVDPHELMLNLEISKQMRLEDIKIKATNLTNLDTVTNALNNAFKAIGSNVTIPEFQFLDGIMGPFAFIGNLVENLISLLKRGIYVIVAIIAVLVLVMVSPVISLAMMLIKQLFKVGSTLTRRLKKEFRTNRSSHHHDYYV